MAGGQISPSPIDFHRRPYNTLALPCERVIKYLRIKYLNTVYKYLKYLNTEQCICYFNTIIVEKLNSLKHLVKTTVAESHN